MSRILLGKLVAAVGGLVVAFGAGLAWIPAGVMIAGVVIAIVGLLFIEEPKP